MTQKFLLPVIRAALPAAGGEGFCLDGELFEEFGMGTDTNETDCISLKPVNQQKVSTDMALSMIRPISLERMVKPLRSERGIICNDEQNNLFQSHHIEAARTIEPLPLRA